MFLSIIFILLSEINGNEIFKDNLNYPYDETEIYLIKSNRILKTNPINFTWNDISFILTLIILFSIFVICLYYHHLLVNYLFNLWSKIKSNNDHINEHLAILQQTQTSNISSSIYPIVPQNPH